MGWPTRDHDMAAARNEIMILRQKLEEKEALVHEMEKDMNQQVLKEQGLRDIIDTKVPSQLWKKLEVKALQNAELTVQVQQLRFRLQSVAEKNADLESELKAATEAVERMSIQGKSQQRLLVEMSDVVRALGQIEIKYDKQDDDFGDFTSQGTCFENIRRKISAVEVDRQRCIEENQKLQTEIFEKNIYIDDLEKDAMRLETIENDCRRLVEENEALQLSCETKDRYIRSITDDEIRREHLEMNVSARDSCATSPRLEVKTPHIVRDKTTIAEELGVDGGIVIITSSTNTLPISEAPYVEILPHESCEHSDEELTLSSFDSPSKDFVIEARLSQGDEHYCDQVSMCCEKGQLQGLQEKLEESLEKITMSKKKQEVREKLLRDVIFQYKELQKEHDEVTARLAGMQARLNMHSELSIEPSVQTSLSTRREKAEQKSPTITVGSIQESSTSATTEISADVSVHEHLDDAEQLNSSANRMQSNESLWTEEEYCRLEKEFLRLEHEYEDSIARIRNLEEDLETARAENSSGNMLNQAKEREVSVLQHKYDELEVECQSSRKKIVQLEGDLEHAQSQAGRARKKQRQREKDLWDVIDQYKKLAKENKSAKFKIQGVETELGETQEKMEIVKRELLVAKNNSKRRDMIHEYRKMQQDLEDCKLNIVNLERDLRISRTEASRSKEETKSTRKRLAGCHFHFKQLQAQYDEIVSRRSDTERELAKAERDLKLYKAQHECWTDKLIHVREKRKEASLENERLVQENTDLKEYCNDLLLLASENIEAL